MVILCLTFWGSAKLFSTAATPCYTSTSSVWRFHFLSILPNTLYFPSCFHAAMRVGVRGVPLCVICVPQHSRGWDLFLCSLAFGRYSWRNVCSCPLPIFKLNCLSFHCWNASVLYVFWVVDPYQMFDFPVFSAILCFLFASLMVSLGEHTFLFWQSPMDLFCVVLVLWCHIQETTA